jgi:hypothetical protein
LPEEIFPEGRGDREKDAYFAQPTLRRAISEYLERHPANWVTERLNEVYSKEDSKLDRSFSA